MALSRDRHAKRRRNARGSFDGQRQAHRLPCHSTGKASRIGGSMIVPVKGGPADEVTGTSIYYAGTRPAGEDVAAQGAAPEALQAASLLTTAC